MSFFACDCCGGLFEDEWSQDEALAEALTAFTPLELGEHPSVICDACWRAMRAAMPDMDARYAQ